MRCTLQLALGLLLTVVCGPAAAAGEVPGSATIGFDDAEVGQAPRGFTSALTGGGELGSWIVQEDPTAPSGKKVLVQTSADKTNSRFPVCVFDGVSTADGTFSVGFKPISGSVDQAAGIVWRYQDSANYYLVRANALEGNVVLYKVEGGKRTDLPLRGEGRTYGKKTDVPAGQWSTLRVVANGRIFEVYFNGVKLYDVEDGTFIKPGKVGVWTKADSVTQFDDLIVMTE